MSIRIAIISQPDVWSGSICLLMDFLHAAGKINTLDINPRKGLFECTFVSVDPQQYEHSVHCFNGLQLYPDIPIRNIKDDLNTEVDKEPLYDAIIVPALWGAHKSFMQQAPELSNWLQAHHQNGAIISGLVTGSFLMASAGLLDFKQATVHWSFAEQFRFHFPRVNLTTDLPITQTENCWCTADINASLEIGIRLLAHFYGAAIAEQAQRYFLANPFYENHNAEKNTTGKFPTELQLPTPNSQLVKAAIEIINQDYQSEISLPLLAKRLNVTSRTLSRHFRSDIALSAMEVVSIIRLRQGCALLEGTDLPINLIAYKTGFQTVNNFSRVFKKILAVSAREWRRSAA